MEKYFLILSHVILYSVKDSSVKLSISTMARKLFINFEVSILADIQECPQLISFIANDACNAISNSVSDDEMDIEIFDENLETLIVICNYDRELG